MSVPEEYVGNALTLYYDGTLMYDIRITLKQLYGYSPTRATVHLWINKYRNKALNVYSNYFPQVSSFWIASLTVIKINRKNFWQYDILDEKTHFLLATVITLKRSQEAIRTLMQKAIKIADKIPRVVIGSMFDTYLDRNKKAFGCDVEHIQSKKHLSEYNIEIINCLDRVFFRRRNILKHLRTLKTMNEFSEAWIIDYNYFKPDLLLSHQTPAEAAGIKYQPKSWEDIVKWNL